VSTPGPVKPGPVKPGPVKVVCVVHDAPIHAGADLLPGASAVALHAPEPDEPPEQPDDVTGVVTAWFDHPPSLDEIAPAFPGARLDVYAVDERVRIEYERDWADGVAAPGVERISFVRALPGLTRAEMAAHWGDVHWPIARVHHPALWRYVQNVVLEVLTPESPDVDGIAQLTFRTVTDLRDRFYDSDAGKQVVADDVAKFLDRGAGWRILARETWLRSSAPSK
jgi:uncharacterized protein (TIGR02118 family)